MNTKKVNIVLGGPHTHAGEEKEKGDLIEVRDTQATRLIEHHGAHAASDAEIKAASDANKE